MHSLRHQGQAEEFKAVSHMFGCINESVENQIPDCDVKKGKTNNNQAHHRTTAESNLQSAIQAAGCTLSGSAGSIGCCLHTQKAGKGAKEAGCQKGYRHKWVLHAKIGKNGKDDKKD